MMKIAVLGTGMVGTSIATRARALGHDVMMGARQAANQAAKTWATQAGGKSGAFADAARHGELIFNCTLGSATLEVLELAGAENLANKILVDVANPLDASRGLPLTLSIVNTDSLGEAVQRKLPRTKVVKALNTVNCKVMVDPSRVPGRHVAFVCGNDDSAKAEVVRLLQTFGWPEVIDLGDISAARATEQLLPIWMRLWSVLGTTDFNFAILRAAVCT